MTPRVLLGSSEVPGSGGSATAAYDLFRRMAASAHDAHFIAMIDDDDSAWADLVFGPAAGNPAGLPNVHRLRVPPSPRATDAALARFISEIRPDVIAGFGFIASHRLKVAAPHIPVAYVTGSCRQAQDYVTSGWAHDAVDLRRKLASGILIPRLVHSLEGSAVDLCDLVIAHSRLTHDMMSSFFPHATGKTWPEVIPFADWIIEGTSGARHLARPFHEREIDVLFIATDWKRTEKNYPMVEDLSRRLTGCRMHVIGNVPFRLGNVVHHGFMSDRDALFALIGNARCVACPSLIDAAPGVLYEATALGANVVATPNCGNAHVCPPGLLSPTLDPGSFADCIQRALVGPVHAAQEEPTWRAFDDLVRLLGVLADPIAGQPSAA